MIELKLTLLGGFGAQLASGPEIVLPGQKDRALLAYLAIAPGGSHPRERLAGLLWSLSGEQQARDSLKQALLRLRRCFGSADGALLRTDRQSIALDRAAVDVDVSAFLHLAQEMTVDALAQATTLYRGDLLDGLGSMDPAFEEWLSIERRRLRQLYERALRNLMSKALEAGDHEGAGTAARRLQLSDAFSEAACRALMLVHAHEGQIALALKVFEELGDRLRDQLGVRPAPETVAVLDRIRSRRTLAGGSDAKPVPPPERPSLAVLPFVNLSNDPDQQYFSDGITEDLITELSRFQTLFIIAREGSFRYRGGGLDIVTIGKELGVRYLAEGSVRRIADRIRISAQLVDAQVGNHLWAETYDRHAGDILVVQDEIVRAIATTLGYRVEAASRERARRLSPEALTAHDLVLRADYHHLRQTKKDNIESRRLAERAVALDPSSAEALIQLGWTYCLDHLFGWTDDRKRALEQTIALARRSVAADERDSRTRTLLGFALLYQREFEEARAQLCAAIALNQNDEEAHAIYGVILTAVGEHVAAIEQFEIAKRYNPFEFTWVTACRGVALFSARRYQDAIDTLIQLPEPNNEVRCWLAASYAKAGRIDEARATLAKFLAEAERDMPDFPGRSLERWKPHLRGFLEYRDTCDSEHLLGALAAAGLE
jgi:TolB-like protein/cytochrome c-type biogenesis protein CcmH/NrfG